MHLRPTILVLFAFAAVACASKPAQAPPPRDAVISGSPTGEATLPRANGGGPAEDDSPIPIGPTDPSWGSRNALVTMVEFADFQCPFCARADATLRDLQKQYGPDKLRVVWKHLPLPFHPHARPAAEAAQGIFTLGGNDAFWGFRSLAFDDTAKLPDDFDAWATTLGVDARAFHKGMAAHAWAGPVDGDLALAKKLGAVGTPTFFVNGVRIVGAQPADQFRAVIDAVLAQAQEALDKGAPRDRLYAITSTFNFANEPKEEESSDEAPEDTKTVWKVPVGQSPVRGAPTALVTIVEFADFQCPFCKKVEETLRQIRTKYGADVRFVWKNEPLPFHPRAEPAAEVAYEARAQKGDAGFWDAHDRIFDSQPKLEDPDLLAVARDMHLNASAVEQAMRQHKYKRILDDETDFAEDMQAEGTPHFFINGRRLVGAQPLDRFTAIIDEELAHAKAVLAKGVSASALYETLIKSGREPPPPERRVVSPAPAAPARGPATAAVTIIEFADFQCPYCKRAEETLNAVLKGYAGRVRIVWRNLPLAMHPDAQLAAQAAMEAYRQKGADGFWRMHDLLFANQGTDAGLKREALDRYATQLGLDAAKWKRALDASEHQTEIAADTKAATDAKIEGTPAFLINGYLLSGAQPYGKFRKLIERALAEKK